MEYIFNKKNKRIIFISTFAIIFALLMGALIRTSVYNNTDRSITLNGEELSGLPDYSGLEVSTIKTAGGWYTEIEGRTFDAYNLNLAFLNSTEEDLADYRAKFTVNDDVYFITAWCGTIEFHQTNSEGKQICQTIDLRAENNTYIVDTVPNGEDSVLIPLHAGDYFVYIPSKTDGEAPIAAGVDMTTSTIMYYEPRDVSGDVFTFVPAEKRNDSETSTDIGVTLAARTSTWTKIFDLEKTGTDEPDYQAYTYDLTIANKSGATLSDYTVKLSFGNDVYIASAWNGSVTIYQGEKSDFIEDLRSFDVTKLSLDTVNIDGENFIYIGKNDYLIYTPNTSVTNPEIPVSSGKSSVPGFIVYIKIGDDINNANLSISYKLHKSIVADLLFKIGISIAFFTLIFGIICIITAYQQKRFEEIHQNDRKIVNESIETFTSFIDAKDPYTNGHSRRVAEYTKLIAEKMGYKGEELERIYYVALLHDSGKIGVSDSILGKPDKLTDEEYNEIKKHTTLGGEILKNFKSIEGVTEGAMYHHERYDGKGYPEGRKGNDIPLIARIICVADSFDAMNSNRCYRKKLSKETIIGEIVNNKGKQFDPEIADIMLQLIESGEIVL